jgi:glycosyltransferase involved in cell wall biosynthesis
MDAFVLSSLHEGIPTVLLEAMALRTPVVATAVGGIPEVIDKSTGRLVQSRDDSELARQIVRLLSETDETKGLVGQARLRVEQHFTTLKQSDNVHRAYQQVTSIPDRP